VFQLTGLNKDGKYWMGACPAKKDDYFEVGDDYRHTSENFLDDRTSSVVLR
jgi:hypothetical protein